MGNRWLPSRLRVSENYSPLKRRDAQKFTVPLIFYIPFAVAYAVYGQRPYDLPVVGTYFPTPTPTAFVTAPVSIIPTGTLAYALPSSYFSPTPSVVPTLFDTRFPFSFPVITDKGPFYSAVNTFLFSYYYPDLGGTNCHPGNWVSGRCLNVTASHVVGWREYIGKGVALHPDMLELLPFGSMIYVSSPSSISGYYTVVDQCNGCLINGNYYFDFIFSSMPSSLTWSVPVQFGVIRIAWDGYFPTITPVPSVTPTVYASPTSTPTVSYVHTDTPYIEPTYTPYTFPTDTPLVLPTDTPVVVVPTDTPVVVPTDTPVVVPTDTPVP